MSARRGLRAPLSLAGALAAALAAGAASAQSVQVQIAPPPHYVGDAIDLQIVADQFDEEPTPEVEIPPADRDRLEFVGVAPNVSTSITIVNSQVTRTKEVRFVYSYRLRVDRPGPTRVGPFAVVQGATRRETRPLRIDARPVPSDDRIGVELMLPDGPVYLGERVPVELRFHLRGALRQNLYGYTLRVPLFDRTEDFRFLEPAEPGETDVKLDTAKGELTVKGDAKVVRKEGEEELVVSLTRIAVPLRDGDFRVPPATLDVEEGVHFRRDLFGGRKPTQVRRWRASDRPKRFRVERIPTTAKTPPGFAGAVGSGLTLSVEADRTVVQVGEPIALTFELRGDGNLETAALPKLDAPGLLPPSQFHVPDGELAGRLEDGAKTFTATVRVIDPAVTEIPALAYSWFDPSTKQFQTTESRPIALSVREAQVIGAAQVQREPSAPAPGAEPAGAPAGGEAAGAPARPSGPLVLTGADLAIERDAGMLARHAAPGLRHAAWVWGVHACGLLLIAIAGVDRRRRDVDPALIERRKRLSARAREIRAAASLPSRDAAAAIATALRALVAERPEANTPEIDALLGECDSRSFAPPSSRDGEPLDAAFAERAAAAASAIAEDGQ